MLLNVQGLTKEFHRSGDAPFRAVSTVSFALDRGETVGIVGESGSGKSTVGRCILRLLKPTSGSVEFDGHRIDLLRRRQLRRIRPRMQMVFQDPYGSVNPAFTVRATLLDALRSSGLTRSQKSARMRELLDSVGLAHSLLDRRASAMSGGQLQRLAIARALAPRPDFIFLDEPTSALDVSIRGQVVNLLAELQERLGIAYLFVSHDLSVVRVLANRVMVMFRGEIVESGPTSQVLAAPKNDYTRSLIEAAGLSLPTAVPKGSVQ